MNIRWLFAVLLLGPGLFACAQNRIEYPLDGTWQLQVDGESPWREVTVPGVFEEQISFDFDGIATYRKTIAAVPIAEGRRLILHFDAVATHATVWFNDLEVGRHLGAWTPHRMDVTDAAHARPDGPWEIRVRVDERVGHNTQGFLPVIAPHFGGIWQSVRLIDVPKNWIDETRLFFYLRSNRFDLKLPAVWSGPHDLKISLRRSGSMRWKTVFEWPKLLDGTETEITTVTIPGEDDYAVIFGEAFQFWTPDNPVLYEVKFELTGDETADSVVTTIGIRDVRVVGSGFELNGEPINIRGLLNWGYAPPRTAPSLDEKFMRSEIQFAKDRGFNLMKFCLWVPPRRYLELCDEMGMLAWIEYPTWHPDFSADRLPELQTEYDEFFQHDRNHPGVILRSLTCETGPSADINVIRSLYDRCKERIPDAIVVDDSSWIEWNRVFDFYDDHPYGNNHTWPGQLNQLNEFIGAREQKPLVLGEAIAADTWTAPAWFNGETKGLPEFCQPNFLEASRQWLDDARRRYGESAVTHLLPDSKRYAMLMRKYQMETFRRVVPVGGYVVSVMRDMPLAAMGLIDYRGQPKWQPEDWGWHGDRMLLLEAGAGSQLPNDNLRRGYFGGQTFTARVFAAGFDAAGIHCEISLAMAGGSSIEMTTPRRQILQRDTRRHPSCRISAALPVVREPTPFTLQAQCKDDRGRVLASNIWQFWLLPDLQGDDLPISATVSFLNLETAPKGFHNLPRPRREFAQPPVLMTATIDQEVLEHLESGNSVVLLASNQPNSFPTESHWFLRGGPVVSERLRGLIPRELLIDTQHFDMAGDVVRDIQYLDSIDPLFMLWEAHDLDHIKTNGLLFHMPVASGNLFVTALDHSGPGTAGDYVLQRLVREIAMGDLCDSLKDERRGRENLARLQREMRERKIMLENKVWRFKPDPDQQGRAERWFAADHDDSAWSSIRIDGHWESQGHDSLDHWAWYRLPVDIPDDWDSPATYLNFTGVDDYYDVFVNGEKVGSGGDIEKRETAFSLRTSHYISAHIQPGSRIQVSVAVYDWYGAGGIFRPVWISTSPISDEPRMLK